jgi:hypothetical protein
MRYSTKTRQLGLETDTKICGRNGTESVSDKFSLPGLLEQIDVLGRQIQDYETRIAQAGAKHPELERLISIPGVGTLTALTFVLTLGRAERFSHSRDVAAFLDCAHGRDNRAGLIHNFESRKVVTSIYANCWSNVRTTLLGTGAQIQHSGNGV